MAFSFPRMAMADCSGCAIPSVTLQNDATTRRCGHPWQHMSIDLSGQVVPCGYWSNGSGGGGLGDANERSVMEIWNGPEFQELRRRHTENDLNDLPCGDCTAKRMMRGLYPSFDWGTFRHEAGHLFIGQIPQSFWAKHHGDFDEIEILEDGALLPMQRSDNQSIIDSGGGRCAVWSGHAYFSSSDGLSPSENGRRYSVRCREDEVSIAEFSPGSASGENLRQAFRDYLSGESVVGGAPTRIGIIESADCNIDCPHCSQNEVRLAGVRQRPGIANEVLQLMPQLQELIWQGGEPFMSKGFRQLLDDFTSDQNPNLSLSFMSNGTLISEAAVEKLKRFPRLNAIISVDSFEKTGFEALRAGAIYEEVMENLARLEASKNWPDRKVSTQMVVGKAT